jgi:hypothetical protein
LETKLLAATLQRLRSFGPIRQNSESLEKKAFQRTRKRKKLLRRHVHVLFFAPIHLRDCITARSQPLNIEE